MDVYELLSQYRLPNLLDNLAQSAAVLTERQFLNSNDIMIQTFYYKKMHLFILPNGDIIMLDEINGHTELVDSLLAQCGVNGFHYEKHLQNQLTAIEEQTNSQIVATIYSGIRSSTDLFIQTQGVVKVVQSSGRSSITLPNPCYYGKNITNEQFYTLHSLINNEIIADAEAFDRAKARNNVITDAFEALNPTDENNNER